ncbi:hypothetical protein OF83DRAFT_1174824 [Amylostereum chailletii]|nr:hypothetical protein OF83DRAFT_1174824 [Amylostereum chailletii]
MELMFLKFQTYIATFDDDDEHINVLSPAGDERVSIPPPTKHQQVALGGSTQNTNTSVDDSLFVLRVFLQGVNTLCDEMPRCHHDPIPLQTNLIGTPPDDSPRTSGSLADPLISPPIRRVGPSLRTFTRSDPYSKDPLHAKFLDTVAKHFIKVLKIDRLENLLDVPNLTENLLLPSTAPFRYDFEQTRDSESNTEAIYVFALDLRHRVLQDGWYQPPTFPSKFLEQDYIEFTLFRHLQHVHRVYADLKNPRNPAELLLEKTKLRCKCRRSKKFKARGLHVQSSPHLQRHLPIYWKLGSGSVSAEETDTETEDGGDKQFKVVAPGWCSVDVVDLQHQIAAEMEEIKDSSVKSTPGFAPFERRISDRVDLLASPPQGLPHNCIDPSWLTSLRRSQRDALRVQKNAYVFNLN